MILLHVIKSKQAEVDADVKKIDAQNPGSNSDKYALGLDDASWTFLTPAMSSEDESSGWQLTESDPGVFTQVFIINIQLLYSKNITNL